jgi:LysM repeat protein/uncharacterized Zn finger protein (UPF0148 family)
MDPPAPASDLPAADSSRSFPPVEDEQTKGRIWNGYVCPGCRSVFRVAADFSGTDVMCPACNETLRLPKTPDATRPLTVEPIAKPAKPTKPARSAASESAAQDAREESAFWSMLSSSEGRVKLLLALLVPVAVVVAMLLVFRSKDAAPPGIAAQNPALDRPLIESPAEPVHAPPPPPVAVSEMPGAADPAPPVPTAPEPEQVPAPGIAASQALPPPAAPEPEIAEKPPEPPEASPVDVPPPAADASRELVETIPAEPKPMPEKPAAAPAVVTPAPAAPAAAPQTVETPQQPAAPRFHTVVKGDTLERIGRKYRVNARAIMKANGMKNDIVRLGRKLTIPPAAP